MARCGCSSGCGCQFEASSCIGVSGSGRFLDPYSFELLIDSDTSNNLECRIGGAYVNVPVQSVLSSTCISLVLNAGQLVADVIVDPDPSNVLECRATGMYAPATQAAPALTGSCISGDGAVTPLNVQTAPIAISSLNCVAAGLKVHLAKAVPNTLSHSGNGLMNRGAAGVRRSGAVSGIIVGNVLSYNTNLPTNVLNNSQGIYWNAGVGGYTVQRTGNYLVTSSWWQREYFWSGGNPVYLIRNFQHQITGHANGTVVVDEFAPAHDYAPFNIRMTHSQIMRVNAGSTIDRTTTINFSNNTPKNPRMQAQVLSIAFLGDSVAPTAAA